MSQRDMFEPERKAELDQFFTEAWIARRAARWLPKGGAILEPSCGSGNLVEGLVRAGHSVGNIVACELDLAWAAHARARFPGLDVREGDFLETFGVWRAAFELPDGAAFIDASLQNPPYGNDLDMRFVERTLLYLDPGSSTSCVVAVLKADFEYSAGRSSFWREKARVRRRAQLVERPRFGDHVDHVDPDTGKTTTKKQTSAERNYVVLEIVPRLEPRAPGAVESVLEERWSRTDPESCWTGTYEEACAPAYFAGDAS